MKRGDLPGARSEADASLSRFPSADSDWYWRFSTVKAEILVRQGFNDESLALLKPELPSSLGTTDLAVWRKLTQGTATTYLLRFDEAAGILQQADSLARAHHPELLGEVALRTGTLASLRGDTRKSEADYRETLRIAREQKDPFLEVAALGSLGLVSTQQEHYDESIEWNDRALPLSRTVGAKDSESYVLGNLGWSYFEIGDYDRALELLEQAEVSSAAVGSVAAQIDWLTVIANIDYYVHDYDAAEKTSLRGLQLARELNLKTETRDCLNSLAKVALKRNDLELATKYNDEALAISRASQDPSEILSSTLIQGRIEGAKRAYRESKQHLESVLGDPGASTSLRWEAQSRLAEIDAAEGHGAQAEARYRQALGTIEKARTSIKDEELRVSFLSSSMELYEDYIGFLVSQQREEDALQVAELSRARTLAEGLAMAPRGLSYPMPNFHPRQVAERLKATLLFYWIGQERSYLWVITPEKLSFFALPQKAEIDSAVKTYRQKIVEGRDVLAVDRAAGEQLYRMLVEPASRLIPKNSRVILLAGEGLYGLNFETLVAPDPQPHYWIEDVTLSAANSLALLSAQSQRNANTEKNLLLVGNPDSQSADFPVLAQAPAEIQKVSGHFPVGERTVLEGREATASAYLRSEPERFSYLHFVTHGTASRTRPLESAVVLTREGDSDKLYARDIVAHPLKARLVTISACNGAGTRAYAGEGLVGLSWAFLRAGAHNVIASLWEVSDATSTAALMDAMYSGIDQGQEPAVALRNAKLLILKSNSNTVFRKPFYWAPFQLYAGS